MPNWCHNRLQVSGDARLLAMFVGAVSQGPSEDPEGPQQLSFEVHRPTPAALLGDHAPGGPSPDWRTWRRAHWGTKWDALDVERDIAADGRAVTYRFATAWNPPHAWLSYVAALLPHLAFHLEWAEEFQHFAGYAAFAEGRAIAQGALDPDLMDWIEWVDGLWVG